MKRVRLILFITIITIPAFSQTPESFSFQAIVRNDKGQPIANRTVSFRFNILKGSPSGQVVYEEEHDVSTDDFGFVGLAIGNGTVLTGSFATIDWGIDAYFLNVGLDTLGGPSYTDMGTSQLLSVPYALYAKTAANGFSGNYNDLINKPVTDGSETKVVAGSNMNVTGTGTAASPYTINNGFSGSYKDLTDKPITDGSESKVSAGSNLIITGSGTIEDPYIISERIHYVGESYSGGIIFYVYDNGRHGLIAASTDQDPAIEWYNGTKRYTNTTGDGVGAGAMNTTLIIALQTEDNPVGNFAAKVCSDYSVTTDGVTLGDWYLPSKYELALLFSKKDMVGGFANDYYWSSTEFSSISAWSQNFSNGYQYNLDKSLPYGVRAIRAF